MKQILISSFDMSVGGVERSLINLLEVFNYDRYGLDLMLYRHQGEFMQMISERANLLNEMPEYATFRKSILEITKEGMYEIALSRLISRYAGMFISKIKGHKERGLVPMQLGWKLAVPTLPSIDKVYDVAISYLWPHYFVGEKVNAKKKIAWIHTDYSFLEIDNNVDSKMWDKFDRIVAVSDSCRESFLKKYPHFEKRTIVIENIASDGFIKKMALEDNAYEIVNDKEIIKIITVARIAYAKGIDNAVRACKTLLDRGYNIKWYVVGYGNEECKIKELIKDIKIENIFILLGKKINPYPYVKACDIYVQPSRYEGKAVTVTEAQILGKPVLLTNYSTAKSQVIDGFDGIITDLGVDGIVSGLQKLIDNPDIIKMLQHNTTNSDYSNASEIEKLYSLIEE